MVHQNQLQWSAVTVTPSGIGKSVTVTDCHSNSSFLRALKWPMFEQNPSTFDWYVTQNAKSSFYLASGCSNQPWNMWLHKTFLKLYFIVKATNQFTNLALFPLIFDQYELWNPFTSVKLSKKSISGVYIDIGPLKNPKKAGFMKESECHCNRFFVTVTACLLVLMNRGLQKLSL